jgi:hypothetical protein
MKRIGLPDRVAYACLAETIVLALEGRYENFTVGRNLSWPRVKEIYRLVLKHGMKLATISGVNGPYTDEDFDRVRAAALTARSAPAAGVAAGTIESTVPGRRCWPGGRSWCCRRP